MLLFLLLVVAGCTSQPLSLEERIQGEWIAFEGEASGEPTLLEGYGMTIRGDSYAMTPASDSSVGTIVLDHSTTPVGIVFVRHDGEEIAKGVIGFRDQHLVTCIAPTDEVTPTTFKTSTETHAIMMVLRRKR